jgi:hypothetical protein
MASEALELQKLKLDKLHQLLRDVWANLSPSDKRRRIISYQFSNLEKKVRVEQQKLAFLIEKREF